MKGKTALKGINKPFEAVLRFVGDYRNFFLFHSISLEL